MKLYRQPGQTTFLVAEDAEGVLWMVPARLGGWRDRSRFKGHTPALVSADADPEALVLARTAGCLT